MLAYGDWRSWPEEEQAAVEGFFRALWTWTLETPPIIPERGCPVDDLLCGIARAIEDLSPYLDYWRAEPSWTALQHLAGLIVEHATSIYMGKFGSPYWRDNDTKRRARQVLHWLKDERTLNALEDGYLRHSDEENADLVAGAADALTPLVRKADMFNRILGRHTGTVTTPGVTEQGQSSAK